MPPFVPPIVMLPLFLDDKPHPILDPLLSIIEYLYETSGLQALLDCDNPNHTRGWKIDYLQSVSPEINTQGIDIGINIPTISWAPCGCYEVTDWPAVSVGLGTVSLITQKLRRKALRKIRAYIKDEFMKEISTFRKNWYKWKNIGVGQWSKFVKLPPVPPGHKRLYRMNSGPFRSVSNSNGFGTGRWFTDDIGPNGVLWYERNHGYNGTAYVTYVDVPIDYANDNHMGNPNGKWRKILAESGERMDGGHGADPSKLIDNPARFVGGEGSAQKEYFLDDEYANQATKIAQFSSLPDIDVLKDAWRPFEDLFDSFNPEAFLDNIDYKIEYIRKWNTAKNNLQNKLSQYFDNSDFVFKWLMEGDSAYSALDPDLARDELGYLITFPSVGLNGIFKEDSLIMKKAAYYSGLVTFIVQILSVTDVVKDKNCSWIGRSNSILTEKDKKLIEQARQLNIDKLQATWPTVNPETCVCNECPQNWNFCDNSSLTNLYSDIYNKCIPPCCGNKVFKPATLTSSCRCECSDDQVFLPCECSSCKKNTESQSVYTILVPSSDEIGWCFDKNPNPNLLEWNSESCSWECKNYKLEQPPHLWGGIIKKPLDKCPENQNRTPDSCECSSGSYEIKDCDPNDYITLRNSLLNLL